MIVAAIAPNIESNSSGSMPRIVVPEAIATGTIRLRVARDQRIVRPFALGPQDADLLDKHHGVLDIHANKSQQSQQRKEVEHLARNGQPSTTPIKIRGSSAG